MEFRKIKISVTHSLVLNTCQSQICIWCIIKLSLRMAEHIVDQIIVENSPNYMLNKWHLFLKLKSGLSLHVKWWWSDGACLHFFKNNNSRCVLLIHNFTLYDRRINLFYIYARSEYFFISYIKKWNNVHIFIFCLWFHVAIKKKLTWRDVVVF